MGLRSQRRKLNRRCVLTAAVKEYRQSQEYATLTEERKKADDAQIKQILDDASKTLAQRKEESEQPKVLNAS